MGGGNAVDHGRLFVTSGTSVLTELGKFLGAKKVPAGETEDDKLVRTGRISFLKTVQRDETVAQHRIDKLFPGLSLHGDDDGHNAFDDLVREFDEHGPRLAVPELRALQALIADGVVPGPVGFLGAAQPANHFAVRALRILAGQHGWVVRPDLLPELGRSMSDKDRDLVVDRLVTVLRYDPGAGRPSTIVVAGGMKPLVSLLPILADRSEAKASLLMGEGSEAWLMPMSTTSAPKDGAVNAVIPSITASLAAWDALPAEVQFDRASGGRSVASRDALARMAERTEAWVRQDVWQADRLPHMVHHGVRHGRRVDRLAMAMLRVAPMLKHLDQIQKDTSFEALSAAAWLHDIGQRGGMVGRQYLHDYEHVRLFHGLLSRGIMEAHKEELLLTDRPVRLVAGLLAQRHQRMARLDDEKMPKPKMCKRQSEYLDTQAAAAPPPDPSAKKTKKGKAAEKEQGHGTHGANDPDVGPCPICPDAIDMMQLVSLKEELISEHKSDSTRLVDPKVGTYLAAILRLADAIDIGTHRVDGRWSNAHGTRSVEQVWRRDEVALLARDAMVRGDAALAEALQPLLDEPEWTAPLLAKTTKDIELEFKDVGKRVAKRVREFEKYVVSQSEHVGKHRCFLGAELVVGDDRASLSAQLVPSPLWSTLSEPERTTWFDVAAVYIWGEYVDSEDILESGHVLPLRAVVGPSGERMDVHEGRRRNGS